MSTTDLPEETLEALRHLAANGTDAEISPPMLEILKDQGYAELTDGKWTVADAGHTLLDDKLNDLPPSLSKAD